MPIKTKGKAKRPRSANDYTSIGPELEKTLSRILRHFVRYWPFRAE